VARIRCRPGPVPSSEGVRSRMRLQRRRDTVCELLVRGALWRLGCRYRVDFRPVPSVRRTADIVFTRAKLAVFFDGCFWHRCRRHGRLPIENRGWWVDKLQRTVARDADTSRQLRNAGWLVMRFWEHDDPVLAARRIASRLRNRKSQPRRKMERKRPSEA
jgi:DNA mismatch endonuclease (patch repair protein)